MHRSTRAATAAALAAVQLATALPVTAQPASQPVAPTATDRMARPGTRPAPPTGVTPLPQPERPQIQPPGPQRPLPPRPEPARPPYPPRPPVVPPGGYYPPGTYYPPGGANHWNGGGTIRCESWQYRYHACRANTSGGVRLQRIIAGDCRQGYSWGWRAGEVWVNHGCRADFHTRYSGGGGYYPPDRDNGPSAGAVIGGVAVAAGLIALLSSSSKSKQPAPNAPPPPYVPPPGSTGAPAKISAETGGVTPDARPSLNTCLTEAAKQIGVTGASEIRLDRLDEIEAGSGGYRFRFSLKGVYPDETRTIPTFCRATPTKLVELTFG